MAVVAEGEEVVDRVVTAVHQCPPVIDFEFYCTATDYTSTSVTALDVVLGGLIYIPLMLDLVASESSDIIITPAKVFSDPLVSVPGRGEV